MLKIALFCFISSTVSGITGMGGGILLMLLLAQLMDQKSLIPLHGMIQLASNSIRSFLFRKKIDIKETFYFVPAAAVGALTGFILKPDLPEAEFKIILGFSLVLLSLIHFPVNKGKESKIFLIPGLISGFLSVNIGATGPVIAPFFLFKERSNGNLIGTKALCQTAVHLFKTLLFFSGGLIGIELIPELLTALPAVYLGTWTGKQLSGKVPQHYFRKGIRILTVLLCLRLLYSGIILKHQ